MNHSIIVSTYNSRRSTYLQFNLLLLISHQVFIKERRTENRKIWIVCGIFSEFDGTGTNRRFIWTLFKRRTTRVDMITAPFHRRLQGRSTGWCAGWFFWRDARRPPNLAPRRWLTRVAFIQSSTKKPRCLHSILLFARNACPKAIKKKEEIRFQSSWSLFKFRCEIFNELEKTYGILQTLHAFCRRFCDADLFLL